MRVVRVSCFVLVAAGAMVLSTLGTGLSSAPPTTGALGLVHATQGSGGALGRAVLGVDAWYGGAPPAQAPPPAMQSLTALGLRHGRAPSAADADAVSRVRLERPDLATGLDALLADFVLMDGSSSRLGDAGTRAAYLSARASFLDDVLGLADAVQARGPAADVDPFGLLGGYVQVDLQGLDSTYRDPAALLVDVGGNDVYLNNAGGSNVAMDPFVCYHGGPVWTSSAAALVDLSGNDRYQGGLGQCGMNGGAVGGTALLVDAGGNDTYLSGQGGVNGGSIQGIALLLDAGGNDTYRAVSEGVNGGAVDEGEGFLLDLGGNDLYNATSGVGSNGGGALFGSGHLFDLAGNDTYYGRGGGGTNGGSNAGAGLLVDAAGNDTYVAGYGGTNGGTEGPLVQECLDSACPTATVTFSGLLLDLGGPDYYEDGAVTCHDCSLLPKGQGGAQFDETFTT